MSSYILYSALLLGFAGSFHCLGMCGPIVLGMLGQGSQDKSKNRLTGYLLYFSGKTITYGLLGALFGLFGHGLVLAGFQQVLSVVMGSIMLLLVFVSIFRVSWFHSNRATIFLQNKLVPAFGWILQRTSIWSSFLIGLLNGLLPCGLVYIGLTAAVATGHFVQSAEYMLLFGVGTIPVMLAFVIFSGQLSYALKSKLKQVTPVLMALVGTILVLRGLNLGIPYISPLLDSLMLTGDRSIEAIPCHP
ncbi:MAG: sulfite exporter TauE/SafE family protein [Chitinophagaceae bacterium]|nr:sulfite exporter TauE/SafE family protein [Chitinophagaceae bacterium]